MKSAEKKNQIARINRRLASIGQRLRTTSRERDKAELGDYHTIDIFNGNALVEDHVDLDALERELDARGVTPKTAQIQRANWGGKRPLPVPSRIK